LLCVFQPLRHGAQRVVDTLDIAEQIVAEFHRVRKRVFEREAKRLR
jgi:hypothetical protein